MSTTKTLMLAAAMAMFAGAAAPQRGLAMTAGVVETTSVSHVPAAAQQMALSAIEMQAISGSGFFRKLWRAVVKVVRVIVRAIEWLIEHLPPPEPDKCDPYPGIIDCPYNETTFDPNLQGDVTETYDDGITLTRYYDDEAAYSEGRMSAISQSNSGYVLVNRSTSGGGGDTCIQGSGPNCEYMY
jgi:hypothetical protein